VERGNNKQVRQPLLLLVCFAVSFPLLLLVLVRSAGIPEELSVGGDEEVVVI
jgi:hypothetical protein